MTDLRTYFGFAMADSMFPADCIIYKYELDAEFVKQAIDECGITPCFNPSHRATIEAMRTRFGIEVEIPENPPCVKLRPGESLLVMGVRGLPRLTDRHEYTSEEIEGATFTFSLYEVY